MGFRLLLAFGCVEVAKSICWWHFDMLEVGKRQQSTSSPPRVEKCNCLGGERPWHQQTLRLTERPEFLNICNVDID